ncbi:MAG: preprotein translocase subunit SecG [Candidatus Hydrogenedentes bacterium]|nr:preprotein translocase subunit SecG [Candidatus Hydrogenedentota bacterium]
MLETVFSIDTLWWVLVIMYVPACLVLIVLVLLQKGKGTGFAGAFGVGAGPGSDTVFGPRSKQTLPVRLTYIAATIFMTIAVLMSIIAGQVGKGSAPELLDVEMVDAAVTTGLSDLGIGTGLSGAAIEGGDGDSETVTEDTAEASSASEEDPLGEASQGEAEDR